MRLPEEREHMMLTEAVEVDVLDEDHLVVLLVGEDGLVQDLFQVPLVPRGEEAEHLGDPLRGLLQPLAVGVLPDLTQELLDQLLHSRPSAAPGPHSKRLFSVSTRATRQSRPGGRTGSSKR